MVAAVWCGMVSEIVVTESRENVCKYSVHTAGSFDHEALLTPEATQQRQRRHAALESLCEVQRTDVQQVEAAYILAELFLLPKRFTHQSVAQLRPTPSWPSASIWHKYSTNQTGAVACFYGNVACEQLALADALMCPPTKCNNTAAPP